MPTLGELVSMQEGVDSHITVERDLQSHTKSPLEADWLDLPNLQ